MDLTVGSRHLTKEDIYSSVYLLHRKINSDHPDAPQKSFYARKSDKLKLLLRCGDRKGTCSFRIKARKTPKDDHTGMCWLVTVSDLNHTCAATHPGDEKAQHDGATRGTRMKSAYVNKVIVGHVITWLRKLADPFAASTDAVRKMVQSLEAIGQPEMTQSTARRVLAEALMQMGVTNHDNFSKLPAWIARVNNSDPDTFAVCEGLVPDFNLIRALLLDPDTKIDPESGDLIRFQFHDQEFPEDEPSSSSAASKKRKANEISLEGNKYMYYRTFIAPGTAVRAAPHLKQHVISLSAEPCGGKYWGVLMSAMTITPDDGNVLLAYAHLPSANVTSWCWFLRHLRNQFQVFCEDEHTVIISNWEQGVQKAMEIVLPNTHHVICLDTLLQKLLNVREGNDEDPGTSSTKAQLRAFFLPVAKAASIGEFNGGMINMEANAPGAYLNVKAYPVQAWAGAYINNEHGRSNWNQSSLIQKRYLSSPVSAGRQQGNASNNRSAVFDTIDWFEVCLRCTRMPISKLLDDIYRQQLAGWGKKKQEYTIFRGGDDLNNLASPDAFSPSILCKIMTSMDQYAILGLEVINSFPLIDGPNVGTSWLVGSEHTPGETHLVKQASGKLGMTCSCGKVQCSGIPCPHVCAVATHEQKNARLFTHPALSSISTKLAVDAATCTGETMFSSNLGNDPSILPPLVMDMDDAPSAAGAPKKKKKAKTLRLTDGFVAAMQNTPYANELTVLSTPRQSSSCDHCSRCNLRGHHVSTCGSYGILPGDLHTYIDYLANRSNAMQQQQASYHTVPL
uniref:SWIM-type domain-containing protein n=1 Tax=Mucochytrium quahogii TaxID=96639 RepID=A0A7S2R826_9STRA|mmetsp:Transcript_9775/g.18310  ORF Transcript_9775/g.18310 Transcript_9775/m.18310 type:complete len:790 (+) Transcript_9775:2170-4539(+)|eukprot:CAMPEP_0203760312 /NCGR_PEP_ID=MMETSP0098-20131031/13634_1 /ASSEMBLY_ACC=CAM_ASM_000208 /TAXON_ID=96639 /ORGANISM=" , Strain NY0313808BC1" /LENGTH=789 /DNA_ID=CAMNT_0050653823 /DNA_START=103 /DNA_END=2472 /DNA_ORIENTATION=-